MNKPVVRHFFYYNNDLIDGFLIDFEGFGIDKIVDTSETIKGDSKDFKGNAGVASGGVGFSSQEKTSYQVSRQALNTDAAKFQRVHYDWFQKDWFTSFETMDDSDWSQFEKGHFLELNTTVSFSKLAENLKILTSSNEVNQLGGITRVAPNNNQQTLQTALTLFTSLLNKAEQKGKLVIFSPVGSSKMQLVAHLDQKFIKVPTESWVGELTVFCKIQRFLKPGEKHVPSDIRELYFGQQGRNLPEPPWLNDVNDVINAPGAIIIPVAVYQ